MRSQGQAQQSNVRLLLECVRGMYWNVYGTYAERMTNNPAAEQVRWGLHVTWMERVGMYRNEEESERIAERLHGTYRNV